ncbi:DMT family protein [Planctomycetota bacterium]|nr:DMT family protein [Planctomycetota bacterium]
MTPAVVVPLMLFASSVLMALAWLGHLRFRHKGFWISLAASWFLVLPEYVLNVSAIRWGAQAGAYSGGEMAAFNLCSGVLCVALVSRYFLGERIKRRQVMGFVLMAVAIVLVVYK